MSLLPVSVGSAGGKVLLTGGYLILDQHYSGCVLSLSARFRSHLIAFTEETQHMLPISEMVSHNTDAHADADADADADKLSCSFFLWAPQRSPCLTEYRVTIHRSGITDDEKDDDDEDKPTRGSTHLVVLPVSVSVPGVDSTDGLETKETKKEKAKEETEENPFVSTALYFTLHFLSSVLPFRQLRKKLLHPCLMHLEGDYQFYSAEPPSSTATESDTDSTHREHKQHQHHHQQVNGKTGLGSSAALVASLIAALFTYFDQPIIDHQHHHYNADQHHDPKTDRASNHTSTSRDTLHTMWLVPIKQYEQGQTHTQTQTQTQALGQQKEQAQRQIEGYVCLSMSPSLCLSVCHQLSQLVHCVAQGKIGSGFDISAAFFGSQHYQRFNPACIQPIISQIQTQTQTGITKIADIDIDRWILVKHLLPSITHEQHGPIQIKMSNQEELIERNGVDAGSSGAVSPDCSVCRWLRVGRVCWDHHVSPFVLPSYLHLVLADVQGGAKTPNMVSQINTWRQVKPQESAALWSQLAAHNGQVRQIISRLVREEEEMGRTHNKGTQQRVRRQATIEALQNKCKDEWHTLSSCSSSSSSQSDPSELDAGLLDAVCSLSASFSAIRASFREVGVASGVPIEPVSQTALCNFTESVPGVIACGVPGAGGDDAIYVLYIEKKETETETEIQTETREQSSAVLHALSAQWQHFSSSSLQYLNAATQSQSPQRVIRHLPVELAQGGIQQQHSHIPMKTVSAIITQALGRH